MPENHSPLDQDPEDDQHPFDRLQIPRSTIKVDSRAEAQFQSLIADVDLSFVDKLLERNDEATFGDLLTLMDQYHPHLKHVHFFDESLPNREITYSTQLYKPTFGKLTYTAQGMSLEKGQIYSKTLQRAVRDALTPQGLHSQN